MRPHRQMPTKQDPADGFQNPNDVSEGEDKNYFDLGHKIDLLFIDVNRNPIKGLKVILSWSGKTVTGITPANGLIGGIDLEHADVEMSIKVARLRNGNLKEIAKTTSGYVNKRVTIQSKKLKLKVPSKPHPKELPAKPETPKPLPPKTTDEKKSEGGMQSAWSWVADMFGIRTAQAAPSATPKTDVPTTNVTGDEPKLDFLDTYTGEKITDDELDAAAKDLGCEVEVIKAIAQQESGKLAALGLGAFDKKNRPTILYERHRFSFHTKKVYDAKYPELSSKKMYLAGTAKDKDGKKFDDGNHYGLFSWQYVKLVKAYALDQDAALESCSWGKYQVMGENYKVCGFSNVKDFVKAMSRSEKEHLKALVGFCKGNNFLGVLKNKDWPAIASAYNGAQYKKNNYDVELEAHYKKFISEKYGEK